MSHHPKVRLFCQHPGCGKPYIGVPGGRLGPCCRWMHRGVRPKKYLWTPERDQILRDRYDNRIKGRAAEIALALGWPKWAVTKRAARLGLAYPVSRKEWSAKEERFLWSHAGRRHVHWLAKRLGRSETSVVLKLKRMHLSRRWREGHTLRDLEECFGCDHHVIDRWIRAGWLQGRRRGTRRNGVGGRGGGPADAWLFKDEAILRFIIEHPMEFRLDKVDQCWFMDLILAGGLGKRTIGPEERLEAS